MFGDELMSTDASSGEQYHINHMKKNMEVNDNIIYISICTIIIFAIISSIVRSYRTFNTGE